MSPWLKRVQSVRFPEVAVRATSVRQRAQTAVFNTNANPIEPPFRHAKHQAFQLAPLLARMRVWVADAIHGPLKAVPAMRSWHAAAGSFATMVCAAKATLTWQSVRLVSQTRMHALQGRRARSTTATPKRRFASPMQKWTRAVEVASQAAHHHWSVMGRHCFVVRQRLPVHNVTLAHASERFLRASPLRVS